MVHEFSSGATGNIDPLRPELNTIDSIYANTLAHIEHGAFHSSKDSVIAQGLATDLRGQAAEQSINTETYQSAMDSLQALVPIIGEDGKRSIAGRRLSGGAERLIASRLASPEVDITAPDGAWGRLPEVVKKSLTHYGTNTVIELTSNCTVGCSFCSFASKGPIAAKASFDSALEVIRYFNDNKQFAQPSVDWLYHGTDPFDAKWQNADDTERDYFDIALAHERITSKQRHLFTSTAIPTGEEFRILAFAQYALSSHGQQRHSLRLSKTNANEERYGHIVNILKALGLSGAPAVNEVIPARRGEGAWRRQKQEITPWDIQGPNCRDGVVIKLQGATGMIMQGASSERPDGERSFPIESVHDDGSRTFTIPNYYPSPHSSGYPETPYSLPGAYRDARVTEHTVDAEGSPKYDWIYTLVDDPHRALLRLVYAHGTYESWLNDNAMDLPAAQKHFHHNFLHSARIIDNYLKGGNVNEAMETTLKALARRGFYTAG